MAKYQNLDKSRYEGCLVGGAIGDALGAPLEFLTSEQIKENYGKVTDYVKALPKHPFYNFNPGQYTDDTQMTLIMAKSIIDKNGFDREDFASKLGECYKKKEFRSLGSTCRKACRALSKGKSSEESGIYNAAGVGSAMRASPIGLFHNFLDQSSNKSFIYNCEDSTRLTHNSYHAIAGTTAVALSILYLKQYKIAEMDKFLDSIEKFVGSIELMKRRNDEKLIEDGLNSKILALKQLIGMPYEKGIKKIGNSGYVLEAVPAAIYAFIKSPDDFEKTVINAVNSGGDADTIASIAGALSGAYNGIENIPKRFKENLENLEEIISLADKLFERSVNKIN
jgi:ADP-ribosylglycohydrolase